MSEEKKPDPPVMDADTEAAGQLVLRTRLLVKMGMSFEDPRLQLAVQQLGWWPQVLFSLQSDEAGKPAAEVRIDEKARVVDYNLMLEGVPEGEDLEKRGGALVSWTQQLLGEDWVVHVQNRKKKGGRYKVIFSRDRQRGLDAKPPELINAPFPEAVTQFRRYRTERVEAPPVEDLGPILPVDTKR